MITLNIRNTYDIKLDGKPSDTVFSQKTVKTVGVVPSAIKFIKPKLAVTEGDMVKIGDVLFIDKSNPDVVFLSPGAGTVSSVVYGPKRRLDSIEITLSASEDYASLPKLSPTDLEKLTRDDIVTAILKAGVWNCLKELPFRRIPKSDVIPPAIYVTIDNDEPHTPDSSVYMNGNDADFIFGLSILKKLSSTVNVGVSASNQEVASRLAPHITHQLKGAYPANDPGVFLYYNKKDASENKAWYIKGQDVITLGQTLKTGKYAIDRVIVTAGSSLTKSTHIKTRLGAPIRALIQDKLTTDKVRIVAGGVLTGRQSSPDDYISYTDFAINVLSDGQDTEMFYFFKLGLNRNTKSNTYLSKLLHSAPFKMTTYLNGGERSCIACGECPKVCPVDLMPQYIHKSLRAGDIEEAISHGVLDCAECGLCTYVCPSKIELMDDIKDAKIRLEKETHPHESHS